MCKIFDMVSEMGDEFTKDCEEIFQAIRTFDFTAEHMPEQQEHSSQIIEEDVQKQSSRGGCSALGADLYDEEPMCLSEESDGLMELLNEANGSAPQSPLESAVDQVVKCEKTQSPACGADASLPTQAPEAIQAPTRKRRRNKTAEEIREQAEKLRCRRRDAAARSRKRKADYVRQLEQENEALHRRVKELEQQLVKVYGASQGASPISCSGQPYAMVDPSTTTSFAPRC